MDTNLETALALVNRHRRWPWFIAGGAVVAAIAGVVVWRQVTSRSSVIPTSGTYVSDEVEGRELADGTKLRFTFLDDQMHVFAGGNNMGGSVAIIGSKLFWSEEASTEVGCLPAIALQDTWLSGWLNSGVDVFRDHKRLVLSAQGVRVVLKPATDADL
jgi:heat shock protein HslJ